MINNSLLKTEYLSAQLYPYTLPITSSITKSFKSLASQATIAAGAVSAGLTLLNFDIKSFLDLKNLSEMFSIIVLLDIELDDPTKAFLSQIHESSTLPSYINFLIKPTKGVNLAPKFSNYGYKTNLILLNCGVYFMTFTIFLVLYIPLKIWHKCKENKFTIKAMQLLEFDAFLQLWSQGFMEVSICSVIGIMNSEFGNSVQIVDFAFCIGTLVWVI